MRTALFALVLLTALPACNKDQAAPDQPSKPGEKMCTMIGCINGFRAEMKKATPWLPGLYTFNFDLDGKTVECKGSLPLQACESGPSLSCSPDAVVQIGESGCALPPAQQGFSDIQITGEPQRVRVTISQDDKPLHTADLTPNYVTSQPNGEGCEPTCRSANGEIAVP
jgi:hypothetical protein